MTLGTVFGWSIHSHSGPAYLVLIVGQCVPVDGDDVHVGVAVVFSDLLQLWVRLVDVCIQLRQQDT